MADISQIKLPNNTTYNIKDNNALPLTGGSVTGPVSFGDAVTMDGATIGDLVVNGSASFTNNIAANTINSVEVGSSPKFTDTVTTVTTTGSGNAVTSITASDGALTVTKGTTFSTADTKVYQSYKTASEYTYWRPLLIGYSSGSAASFTPGDQTNLAYTFATLKVQPSTGTIRINNLALYKGSYTTTFTPTTLTADRTITIPNNTGTMALTSDIPSVPAWALESSKPSYTFSEIGSKPTTISGYGITDAYTKTEVDNKVSAVLRYKGVKATVANLPTTGNTTGDVWHVTATSGEYAWDGTEWQELGTAITIPAATGSNTTGISVADHSTTSIYGVGSSTTSVTGVSGSTSVYGVKSGTNSTTTASKASGANGTAPTLGTAITVRGVKTGTSSTTTASKASGGNGTASSWTFEEVSIPNVTSAGSASSWTFEEKSIPNVTSAGSASSWTFEEKTIPNVTAAGSGSASLTFTMDTTDTKKLKITFSHTHTAPTLGTAITVQSKSGGSNGSAPTLGTAIKVQSKSGGSNGSAPTLGTAIKVQSKSGGSNGSASTWSFTDVTVPIRADADTSIPNVTSVGSASTWSFTDVTVPIRADSATTVPTAASSATTVPIKNSSSTTVVTSKTHSVTDNGHTHTI